MKQESHGGDIYRNEVQLDYSVNVNPLGMPASVIEAGKLGIDYSGRYPDPYCEELVKEIVQYHHLSRQANVIVGNGASELIYGLCRAVGAKRGLLPSPSFSEYGNALRAVDAACDYVYFTKEEGFAFSSEKIIHHITEKTDVVFLCNPNNPTGKTIKRDEIIKIMKHCEKTRTYLCVDECFLPFVAEEENLTMLKWIEEFSYLIVLRAFTKIFAMPGLRLGYMITSNNVVSDRLHFVLPSWNVSIPAQMAGVAALKDSQLDSYLARTRNMISQEREVLTKGLLDTVADQVYHSDTNFIMFHVKHFLLEQGRNLKKELLDRKILIRSCSNYDGLEEGYYRIAVKTKGENERLIEELKNIVYFNK